VVEATFDLSEEDRKKYAEMLMFTTPDILKMFDDLPWAQAAVIYKTFNHASKFSGIRGPRFFCRKKHCLKKADRTHSFTNSMDYFQFMSHK
jgi:hypothetical protein